VLQKNRYYLPNRSVTWKDWVSEKKDAELQLLVQRVSKQAPGQRVDPDTLGMGAPAAGLQGPKCSPTASAFSGVYPQTTEIIHTAEHLCRKPGHSYESHPGSPPQAGYSEMPATLWVFDRKTPHSPT